MARTEGLKIGEWFSETRARQALLVLVDLAYVQQGYHRVQLAPEFVGIPGRDRASAVSSSGPIIAEGPRATIADVLFSISAKSPS